MGRVDITHNHRLRVIYAQTDRMNVVYYSRYYEFYEAARSAFLRAIGYPYEAMEAEGILLPVIESHSRYFAPATFEDVLTIETRLNDIPLVKLKLEYRVFKEGRDEPIVTGYTIHSFANSQMKPVRATKKFLKCLENHANQLLEDHP